MRICLLAEGSYPYVMGGVSSWINTLIKQCPEHEFIIYAIGADSIKRGQYKYEIPSNVVEIVEVFLNDMKLTNGKKGKTYELSEKQVEALKGILSGEDFSWDDIFQLFQEKNFNNISEFFMSKNFFNLVQETYRKKYNYTPFTEFIWNIRSMYVTLFFLLMHDMPEADLYHSVSTGYAGVLGSYGKYIYNKPFLLSEHGIYTREREEEIIKSTWIKGYHKEIWIKFFEALSKCAYDSGNKVTTLFKTNKELQIELGCKEEKICTIHNGIEANNFQNIPQKEDEAVINIGAIVRVVPIKDIKTMIMAYEIVKRKVPNTRLYIMGPTDEDEEYYGECLEIVKQFNIQDVVFTGTIKVLDYIGKMDILLLTSISEGEPLAVMEGMAAKKPHVCTNVGDCKELLLGDGDNYGTGGFIEYVMDYEGIAKAIEKLCKDKALREKMGQCGYNRVKDLYTREKMINSFKNLYSHLGGM